MSTVRVTCTSTYAIITSDVVKTWVAFRNDIVVVVVAVVTVVARVTFITLIIIIICTIIVIVITIIIVINSIKIHHTRIITIIITITVTMTVTTSVTVLQYRSFRWLSVCVTNIPF